MTVEIDSDIFKEMLLERADSLPYASAYPEEFWTETVDYLEEIGFMSDPQYNDPKYIIDNIAVNGEIVRVDDASSEYHEIDDEYDGDVDAWADDKAVTRIGDYIVLNWGL